MTNDKRSRRPMRNIQASDVEHRLDWLSVIQAIEQGHHLPKARITDQVLQREEQTLLMRAAWVDGLGMAVKVATIFPGNKSMGLPSVQGNVLLYDDANGAPVATVDFDLVTRFKTVGDSLLAASRLARPDSGRIVIVGAGRIALTALSAYRVLWPEARFEIWNRRRESAERLVASLPSHLSPTVTVVDELSHAVQAADIICTATLSATPVILGQWLRPGQHIDLIGAFRPDMREADDEVMRQAALFVDSRDTTINHIGELMIPIAAGIITPEAVRADFYDLDSGKFARQSVDDITVFKNGGGAHLDLMTARHIVAVSDRCALEHK